MLRKKIKYDKSSWFYLLPAIAIISFIYANPIIRIFWYSLIKWDNLNVTNNFNGFANFADVFSNNYFLQVLFNNLIIIVITIPVIVLFALFCSQFIYLRIFGYKIYQYLFFLPVILPNVVAAIIWTFFLRENGPLNVIFTKLGLDFLVVNWFGNPRFSIYGLILTIIWKDVGFAIVLFLAKLSGADPSLYDAAKVDGANDLQTLRYITIPQLKSVIQLYIILAIIGKKNKY
ncbi:MAG: sugar ABC transporter permease [Actinobacteria bacterium]|nr:sugar ABC transporter permease [Actinomycetota bacterium]